MNVAPGELPGAVCGGVLGIFVVDADWKAVLPFAGFGEGRFNRRNKGVRVGAAKLNKAQKGVEWGCSLAGYLD